MTIASELFYNRRYRCGRDTIELGFESSPDRISNHNHNSRRHLHHSHNGSGSRRDRRDLDGCDPLRCSYTRLPSSRPSLPGNDLARLDLGSSHSASDKVTNSENFNSIHNRQRVTGNDRLPGAVLLARERLLQRLRGVSESGNRQRNKASSGIHHGDSTSGDDFRLIEAGDGETERSRELLAGAHPVTDLIFQTGQPLLLEQTRKRPPGLTQEALDRVFVHNFCNSERGGEEAISRTSQECGICLDSFVDGDELICLPCGHRFHSCCLYPWVRTCGDCPYCRRVITSACGGVTTS